jgi:hypothetical protein
VLRSKRTGWALSRCEPRALNTACTQHDDDGVTACLRHSEVFGDIRDRSGYLIYISVGVARLRLGSSQPA